MLRENWLNMFITLICVVVCIAFVSGSGELTILHHPKSLSFKSHDHIKQSISKEMYSAALGFSTEQYSNWNGLFIEDPFNLAEAIVTVAVDGVSNIDNAKGHNFPLKTDEDESDTYTALEKRVLQRYPEHNSNLIRINLGDGLQEVHKYQVFEKIKHSKPRKHIYTQLKISVDEDREFLNEITLLNNIADVIEQSNIECDNIPDVYWFKVQGLHALTDLYGENSTQVKEAKQLLNDAIIHINNAFNKVYKNKVLVTVICSDAVHTRRTRNILADDSENKPKVTIKTSCLCIFNINFFYS